jgi:hypothetical protein
MREEDADCGAVPKQAAFNRAEVRSIVHTHTSYHGVLAPNAPWRAAVVARARPEEPSGAIPSVDEPLETGARRCARPKYRAWADLMRRVFVSPDGIVPA